MRINPWQLERFDDEVFSTMTREEYHRWRDANRQMVTPGLEGLAALVDPPPPPPTPATVTAAKRGRRTVPAPTKPQRGRRT